jgi:hypothetical protein
MAWEGKYIFSDKYRFVYCVVPKVACTSIKTALLPLFPDMDPRGYENPSWDSSAHYDIHALFDHSPHQVHKRRLVRRLRSGEHRDHFIFAFVRNPYDRLASCWHQKLADGGQGLTPCDEREFGLRVGIGFTEFVEAVHEIPDEEANPHFRSQHVPLLRPNGRLIPRFLGGFENLAEDFAAVAEKLKVELRLPHLLVSKGWENASYRDLYNRKTESLVAERFAKDLELFGYRF